MKNVLKTELLISLSLAAALSSCSSESVTEEAYSDHDIDVENIGVDNAELNYGDAYWANLAQNYERFEVPPATTRAAEDYSIEGRWGPLIDWPEIATGAANLPDGRIVTWASTSVDDFGTKTAFTCT